MELQYSVKRKIRFLSQYPQQPCLIKEEGADHVITYTQDIIEGFDYMLEQVIAERVTWFPNQITLLLKDVNDMTDEDAIQIVKIIGGNLDRSNVVTYGKLVGVNTVTGNIHSANSVEIYQFLQSRGYALPWMGLSVETMVKAEWIKLIGDGRENQNP